jgi:hypothetical protein
LATFVFLQQLCVGTQRRTLNISLALSKLYASLLVASYNHEVLYMHSKTDNVDGEVIYRKTIKLRNGKILRHPTGVFRIVLRNKKK